MNNKNRINLERRIIRMYLKALVKAGYKLKVFDGGEYFPWTTKVDEALEQVRAVDDATVYAQALGKEYAIRFVQGNDPWEVLNDYSVALEGLLDPVTDFYEERYA